MAETGHVTGRRYLHRKTQRPLTLRYIGPLPPNEGNEGETATSSSGPLWLGVEYDDPAHGKGHSGTYEGRQVFQTRQEGAGAFVKYSPGSLTPGRTFVEALEERYGQLVPGAHLERVSAADEVVLDHLELGHSGIVVEAPGLDKVASRINRLERLREIGLDGEWVNGQGGTELQQAAMANRLKAVHTLNVSQNLVSTWEEVADIVGSLKGLRTLIMNHSRIASLPDVAHNIARHALEPFANINELHLGNAGYNWEEVLRLSPLFPQLRILHVNDGSRLLAMCGAVDGFPLLEKLSLSGCPLSSWDDTAKGLLSLPTLTTLDISHTPLSSISSPLDRGNTFASLQSIVLLSTQISRWSDIDALELWTSGRLQSLRISLRQDASGESPEKTLSDPSRISGHDLADRPMYIAKLSKLTMLNLTPVSSAERRDAESWYVRLVDGIGGTAADWGRYEHLKSSLGGTARKPVAQKVAGLKSKMISITLTHGDTVAGSISVLPAASVSLFRKKIGRKLGLNDPEVWTVDSRGGPLAILGEDNDVGWWLHDGDQVIVV